MRANRALSEDEEAIHELSDVPVITRDELKTKIGRGGAFVLVETMAADRFQESHLPGAINLPPNQVRELAPRLLPDRQREIVTYCASRSCPASLAVARELIALGYSHVRHYVGGKEDWRAARLPMERGSH